MKSFLLFLRVIKNNYLKYIGSLFFLIHIFCFSHADCRPEFSSAAEKVLPAVVNISTEHRAQPQNSMRGNGLPKEFHDFFGGFNPFFDFYKERERTVKSLGSGFIASADGLVVTNYHVVASAEKIKVTLSQCKSSCDQYEAKVLGFDKKTDLAVLKINSGKELPYLKFGNSSDLRVGQWVMAVGNPFGLGGSVSVGVVSARSRDINIAHSGDFIQTDVALNSGNSGGPLCNAEGEVIGINTAIYSPSGGSVGVGFAIPSDAVKNALIPLSEGKKIERGWIGVKVQEITPEIKESLGVEISGAIVAEVNKDSPADRGGIKVGDIIVKIDQKKIDGTRMLANTISGYKISREARISVIRDVKSGKEIELKVRVGKLQEDDYTGKDTSRIQICGLIVANLDEDLRQIYNIPKEINGIIVVDVHKDQGSALRKGDVIVGLGNNKTARNVLEFSSYVANLKKSGASAALVLVNRDGQTIFTSLRIE